MTKKIKWIVGICLVLAALAFAIYMARWKDAPTTSGPGAGARGRGGLGLPVSVRAVAARSGSIDVVVDALGTVTALNTVVVRARVDGPLVRVAFEEGREVKAGAVLAEIDPRPYDAALEQVRGQLARDEALLAIAKSDFDRYQTLLEQDSIAKQQVDDQAALVRQYLGSVQADRGTVENARLQREFTRITAPISGRVGLRLVDVGNIVHASDANGVAVLTQTKPIYVVFAIPAEQAPDIARRWQSGQSLRVEAYDRDGKKLLATGRLDSVDNVVDLATSTVKLKALFENKDGALFPNQFVNARITVATLDDQTLIPSVAVQRGTPGTFVYVVGADSTVAIRTIKVGTASGDTVAVANGLKTGERVVVDGTDKLRDGAKVDAAAEAPSNAGPRRRGPSTGAPGKAPPDRAGVPAGPPDTGSAGGQAPRRARGTAGSGP